MEDEILPHEITFEKHGDWVHDELDKVINEVLTGNKSLTLTQINKRVLEKLVKYISKGTTLAQRLQELVNEGILVDEEKETTIHIFKKSES